MLVPATRNISSSPGLRDPLETVAGTTENDFWPVNLR